MSASRHISVLFYLLSWFFYLGLLYGSGAYDHGTSTGKGNLELDFTWNPFDILQQGQSYVVFGYGLTERLDFHGYYARPVGGTDNYYAGLFWQFLDHRYVDLATAVGIRQYVRSDEWHVFVPQLLYNIKIGKGFTVGGSLVTLTDTEPEIEMLGTTYDIALFIPLTEYLPETQWVHELKLGIGAFRPVLWKPRGGDWYPTYSIDVTFQPPWRGQTQTPLLRP